jgi:hypothetical protein
VNAVAALGQAYLRDWPAADADPGEPWPPGWRIDAGGEHRAAGHVERLAPWHPELIEALRDRFDHARRDSGLPIQMIPLLRLHTATIRRQRETIRAAALEALRLGVATTQVLEPVLFAYLYADEETMDIAARELDAILETWPQTRRVPA